MIKSRPVKREWSDALTKCHEEGRCRVCGSSDIQVAHVIGRKCDAELEGPRGGRYKYVHPDSVVPLCNVCHLRL